MKYLTLLLLVSCAYQPKTYTVTQRYKVIGVKCAPGYYYSYEYNACAKERYVSAQDNPSGVSIDLIKTHNSQSERVLPLNKIKTKPKARIDLKPIKRLDCEAVYKEMNRCMQ